MTDQEYWMNEFKRQQEIKVKKYLKKITAFQIKDVNIETFPKPGSFGIYQTPGLSNANLNGKWFFILNVTKLDKEMQFEAFFEDVGVQTCSLSQRNLEECLNDGLTAQNKKYYKNTCVEMYLEEMGSDELFDNNSFQVTNTIMDSALFELSDTEYFVFDGIKWCYHKNK